VLRKAGRTGEARQVYGQLASIDARVAGVPAELIARHELADLSADMPAAIGLKRDLLEARWRLGRGAFLFYWSEAARLSSDASPIPQESLSLADAVSQWWRDYGESPGERGQATIWAGANPYFFIWRGPPEHRAILAAYPESLLKPLLAGAGVFYAALDSEGRVVAGKREGSARAAVRTPAETRLPWTLYLTSAQMHDSAGLLSRQKFLLLVTALMAFFLVSGSYLIARAMRREIAVARMQSNFVSAVSHEFRSPLTSIRQLSEILALGRIPNEQRRQVYYETLVRETTRLQRLIEGLLNFGRMEAGSLHYRFEPLDAASLVSRVAAEFEPQISAAGRRIEIDGRAEPCVIDADPEALSVALRNLVDNALKYAPDCATVQVQWGVRNSQVAISVHDRGPGIPAEEKKAIFRKFVRGSAAAAGNVKGSGVGLAMVHHIVAAHGGNVSLASEPGAGSIFTILLPLASERTGKTK
jgi:signal transduction histidine kinase